MAEDLPENIQRWSAKRRAALVLSILRGEKHEERSDHGFAGTTSDIRTNRSAT